MADRLKRAQVRFEGMGPMVLAHDVGEDLNTLSAEEQSVLEAVGSSVSSYLKSAKALLTDKYASIRDLAPAHLANPGYVLVACCAAGIVIRYETKVEGGKLIAAWLTEDLPQVAALLSQNVVHCHRERNYQSAIPKSGVQLNLTKTDGSTGETVMLATAKIGFEIVIDRPGELPVPPRKPFCLLSVNSTLYVTIHGEILPTEGGRRPQPFILQSPLRLPVGWEYLEIYPFIDLEYWKPEYAPTWAENDILAAVVNRQLRDEQFRSLDANAETRKRYSALLEDYRRLLDSEPEREETLQAFLATNPSLLCPPHTHVWPKLALGAHKTDFVFREATGDYLLVELEKSTHPLFVRNGNPSRELTHARAQLQDWKRYIEDNLRTVQNELGLPGISANPKCLVVIGRSASLSPEDRRKLVTIENEAPRLKIMTYDEVLSTAKAVIENLLGPLWNIQGSTRVYYPDRIRTR